LNLLAKISAFQYRTVPSVKIGRRIDRLFVSKMIFVFLDSHFTPFPNKVPSTTTEEEKNSSW
jgi:hypothetical protein